MSNVELTFGDGQSLLPEPTVRSRVGGVLEYWRIALAYALAAATPVVAYVGNLGFAPLVALIGIGALVFMGRKAAPSIGMAALTALLAWALISMSWSPAMPVHPDFQRYKNVEALTGVKLVMELGFYAAFVVALRQTSDVVASRAGLVLSVGLCALVVIVAVESLEGATAYQWIKGHMHQKTRPDLAMRNVARACYVVTVLFWPVVLRLRRAHLPVLVLVLAAGLCLSLATFKVDAPALALALSVVVFVGVQQFGRAVMWALIAAVVVYFAGAPIVTHVVTGLLHPHELPGQIGKLSWAVRLDIWRFASAEILRNPLKGWGLDASRSWPNNIPLHPHDAALQLWLELGAVGAALAAVFWVCIFAGIAKDVDEDRNMAAASAASAVAYLVIGALSFGVWQEWWLAVGAVAIVVASFVSASRRTDESHEHYFSDLQPIT